MDYRLKNNPERLAYIKKINPFLKTLNTEEYNEKVNKVYALINPVDESIFYIGCTVLTMKNRIGQHYHDPTNIDKKLILNDLLSLGLFPKVEILFRLENRTSAKMVEKCLICFLSQNTRSVALVNKVGIGNISENISDNYGCRKF